MPASGTPRDRQPGTGPLIGLTVGVASGLLIGIARDDVALWLALGAVYGPVTAGFAAFMRHGRPAKPKH